MSRYIQDQNKCLLLLESGTYGVTSGAAGVGIWIGEVQENSVTDSENLLEDRFLGALTRSVSQYVGGPRDVNGTLTYYPQDMRLVFWAIGSVNEAAGTGTAQRHFANQVNTNAWQNPYVSGTGQLNGPISFGLEDSKNSGAGSVFTRTVVGCVIDNAKVIATQGEKVSVEINYIGQNLAYSGGKTALTCTVPSTTPYLWNNCSLVTSGITVNTAKEITLEINQNITAPHYLNGSRDVSTPYFGKRENNLDVTLDLDSIAGNTLYELYKSNASFNSTFDLNGDSSTGSLHTIFFLSGCKVKAMDVPSTIEGTTESKVSITCPTIIGSAIDTVLYQPY